jgi:hypothetical protein
VDYDEGLLYGIEDPNVHYHWAFVPQTLGLMVTDEMWDWLPEQ